MSNPFDRSPFDLAFDAAMPEAVATPVPEAASGRVKYHAILQNSEEWYAARCGVLTASEMSNIITPKTLKISAASETHLFELLAQRITKYVEPSYFSDDMARGVEDEIEACIAYTKKTGQPVDNVGFITNDKWGFTLGYSPDGLVGETGLIECKSRRQKYQVQNIVECVPNARIMPEFMMQVQTGFAVSERQWLDHISYSGGMPMSIIRCHPDPVIIDAIVNAAGEFERRLAEKMAVYHDMVATHGMIPTKRRVEQELF